MTHVIEHLRGAAPLIIKLELIRKKKKTVDSRIYFPVAPFKFLANYRVFMTHLLHKLYLAGVVYYSLLLHVWPGPMPSQHMIILKAKSALASHTLQLLSTITRRHQFSTFTKVAMTKQTNSTSAAPAWHAAYPTPRSAEPGKMSREELLQLLKTKGKIAGQNFVLVDLRRNDHEVHAKPDAPG